MIKWLLPFFFCLSVHAQIVLNGATLNGATIGTTNVSGGGGGGNFVKVFNVAAGGNSGTVTTSATDSTGATTIYACVGSFSALPSSTTFDSKGNTYVLDVQNNTGSGYYVGIYHCFAPVVGTGHTWTITQGIFPNICIAGFSGGSGTHSFDQSNSANAGNVTSLATGSITPTAANELIITMVNREDTATATVDGGFTKTDEVTNSGGNERTALAFLIQTTATASNPTWSGSAAGDTSVAQASYK